ncbi:MAG TPA: thiamine pyrophosphate-dependent enzyme [Candidatus Limnocylindria bacterium]|nr:thiamine pyrophosphate-dependent enzyme [Candidatus Limnocylindria bacterium]
MTGGQALAAALERQGLEVIFGLPGVQLDWLFDALYEARERIQVIHTRNEQPTSYMADGYARSTGKIAACLVVPGPGVMNALAGLSTAYANNSPVLCIAGQIQSNLIDKGHGLLHEVPYQLEMMRSATKWAGRAMSVQEIPALVDEAFLQLRTGRPRPVEIEIPPDVLQASGEVTLRQPAATGRPAGDPDLIEKAAKALGEARQPIIFSGGGVLQAAAWEPLRELAEMLQAPVLMSSEGKGAVSDRSYLAQSSVAGPDLLPQSDVVLVVGTRFLQPSSAAWGPKPEQTVIQIDVDPQEIGRNYPPTIGIEADARLALQALVERVGQHNRKRAPREQELTALKERITDRLFEVQPQASYAMAIRETIADDDIVLAGMTQVGYWSYAGFPVYEPRSFITAGFQGTLGFEFPTALGAQYGNPDRRVIAMSGDGGFLYNVGELATAVQHKIKAIAVVFNDQAYGNVRRTQRQSFGGRVIASELHNPDFVKLAESFGLLGLRAQGPEGLRQSLKQALDHDGPVLIEVPVGEMPSVWGVLRP